MVTVPTLVCKSSGGALSQERKQVELYSPPPPQKKTLVVTLGHDPLPTRSLQSILSLATHHFQCCL